ncbi:MAG TPA: hypothetical protein VG722_13695 [Tepidisphaeraceae bacterium]|nr:hypothetical protein [Tepidisphaeraceae bacterium]
MLIDELAARSIDEVRSRLHFRQFRRPDKIPRLFVESNVQRYEIGRRQQLILRYWGYIQLARRIEIDLGIAGNDANVKPAGSTSDRPADLTESDDAQRFTEHAGANAAMFRALAKKVVVIGNLPGHCEHQPPRQIRDHFSAFAAWGKRDNYSVSGGGVYIQPFESAGGDGTNPQARTAIHLLFGGHMPMNGGQNDAINGFEHLDRLLLGEGEIRSIRQEFDASAFYPGVL